MTTYWCNPSWTITAFPSAGDLGAGDLGAGDLSAGEFEHAPKHPFAVIGGSSRCDVHLPGKHLEPAIYFACVINGCIELWPLSAIAFARWGVMKSGEEFRIGKHRLAIRLNAFDADKSTKVSQDDHSPSDGLTLTIEGKMVQRTLKRAVTIVGSGHPSTLRLYGGGIACCDHAIIKVGCRIWLIDLVFDAMTGVNNQLGGDASRFYPARRAVELRGDGSFYQIGNMKLSLGEPQCEMGESTERRRLMRSHAAQAKSDPVADVPPAGESGVIPPAVVLDDSQEHFTRESFSSEQRVTEQSVLRPAQQRAPVETQELELSDQIDPDSLTSNLTGKLVSRGQSRIFLRRIAMSTVIVVLGCLAILAVFSLLSRLIEVG